MAFTVEAENFGKLTGGPITVGGLTVLAGPNATGKSFFSKALYSILNAANTNPVSKFAQVTIASVREALSQLSASTNGQGLLQASPKHPETNQFEQPLQQLESVCEQLPKRKSESWVPSRVRERLVKLSQEISKLHQDLLSTLQAAVKNDQAHFSVADLDAMKDCIEFLDLLAKPEKVALMERLGFEMSVKDELDGNFLVRDLPDLQRDPNQKTTLDIPGVASIVLSGNIPTTPEVPLGLGQLQQYSKVIYLESPVYWKLQGVLRAANSWSMAANLNVPKYFYDLNALLELQHPGEIAFPEVLERLTGKDVMAGRVTRDEIGRLHFFDASISRSFSLALTATGAINLGILALLIEERIIQRGTFLFIDEPETNLHPRWQTDMIDALFDLARGGVNIVLATHSADILERLRYLVGKHPGAEALVALNHFSPEGIKNDGASFREKIRAIQTELTDPFTDSYILTREVEA